MSAPQDKNLAHHFETPQQQFEAAKIGMWLFLATEILFFSGLFCAYAVYRSNHPEVFDYAHQFLDKKLGAVNTVILLFSSFTMAWGVRAAQLGQARKLVALLAITILCAFGFLGIKYVEYKAKWEHGLLWAGAYHPHVVHDDTTAVEAAEVPAPPQAVDTRVERTTLPAAGAAPAGLAREILEAGHAPVVEEPKNVQVFFSIYFAMTGLHGIHVLVGIGLMFWLLLRARRGEFGPEYFTPVDLVGLYWHVVDLIWIYLFPLLYLIH